MPGHDIQRHFGPLERSLYALRNGVRPSNIPTRPVGNLLRRDFMY